MADADHARLMQQPYQAEARSAASHVTLSSPVAPCTSGSLQLLSPDVFRHIIRTAAAAAVREQDLDEVESLSLVCREARTAVASLITRLSLSPTSPDDGDEQAAGEEMPDGSSWCTGCTTGSTSMTPQGSPEISNLPCTTLLCEFPSGSVQQAAAVAAQQAAAEVYSQQQSPRPTSARLDSALKVILCGAVKQLLAFPSRATLRTLDVNLSALPAPIGGAAAGGGSAGDALVSTEVLCHLLAPDLSEVQRRLKGLVKLNLEGVVRRAVDLCRGPHEGAELACVVWQEETPNARSLSDALINDKLPSQVNKISCCNCLHCLYCLYCFPGIVAWCGCHAGCCLPPASGAGADQHHAWVSGSTFSVTRCAQWVWPLLASLLLQVL